MPQDFGADGGTCPPGAYIKGGEWGLPPTIAEGSKTISGASGAAKIDPKTLPHNPLVDGGQNY